MTKTVQAAVCAVLFLATHSVASAEGRPWSGFGVGIHTGVAFNDYFGLYDSAEPTALSFRDVEDPQPVLGFHLQYNYQLQSNIVLGSEIEMTFGFSDAQGGVSAEGDFLTAETDFTATARAKVGYAFDDVLVHASAGIAFAKYDAELFDAQSGVTGDAGEGNAGIVFGGGVNWMAFENISVFGDVLYFVFDDENGTSGDTPDSDPDDRFGLDGQTLLRIGATYHF